MTLLNPWALAYSALYAVLIWLALRNRARARRDVPSILLWQGVEQSSAHRRRPPRDLLLLFQTLILAFLICGLARPYLPASGLATASYYVFILDTSASMQAREAGKTRFTLARRRLANRLRQLPEGSHAMLITAAGRPRLLSPFTTNRGRLLDQLRRVHAMDTGTDLNAALRLAHVQVSTNGPSATIEVFTDMRPSDFPRRQRAGVSFSQVGATDNNVAISAVDVFQNAFDAPEHTQARVVVRSFTARPTHAWLNVQIGTDSVRSEGFSLPPRGMRVFRLSGFKHAGRLEATLSNEDALQVDNRAFAWIRHPSSLRILVVSDSEDLRRQLARIATGTPNLHFHFLDPREYEPGLDLNADVVIFERTFPPVEPPVPALYIHPPPDNPIFPVVGEASSVELLDWNDRHPLLRGMEPILSFPLRHSQILVTPPWSEALLLSRRGPDPVPLAIAGLHQGHRIAALAFDPAAEGLLTSDHVPLLVFFLRLLSWLAPGDELRRTIRTGQPLVFDDGDLTTRFVMTPSGRTRKFGSRHPLPIDAEEVGEYRISAGATQFHVLANLFDAAESDIGRGPRESVPVQQTTRPASIMGSKHSGLSWWLYALAMVLLLAESALASHRS